MNLLDVIAAWVIHIEPWQFMIVYFFGAVLFGSINKRIQRWRCNVATSCRSWDITLCSHLFFGVAGYLLWPILLPVSIIYSLVELDWDFAKDLRDKMSSTSR